MKEKSITKTTISVVQKKNYAKPTSEAGDAIDMTMQKKCFTKV